MEDKVYYPQVIENYPIPESTEPETIATGQTFGTGNTAPRTEVEVQFPQRFVARELINSSFDSKTRRILGEFTFGQVGSLVVGFYESGVSGDIKISPTGILARDDAGSTTFLLDGTTGDATFKGTVLASSVITGAVEVGSGSGNVVIDGANNRILINDGTNNRILIGYQSGGF